MTHPNGVTLRDYLEARLTAIDTAINLARENIDTRLEGMNEWRAQSKDREQTWITRPEHNLLCDRVAQLEIERGRMEGKASQTSVYIAYGISIIGMIIGLLGVLK